MHLCVYSILVAQVTLPSCWTPVWACGRPSVTTSCRRVCVTSALSSVSWSGSWSTAVSGSLPSPGECSSTSRSVIWWVPWLSLSLSDDICLLSVYLSAYLLFYLSICLSVYLSFYLSICLSVCHLFICLSVYLFIYQSIKPFSCVFVYLSIYTHIHTHPVILFMILLCSVAV